MMQRKPTGPGAAALVAAGVGVFVIGMLTTLAEASPAISSALAWVRGAGPLSGKTGAGVIVWLVTWIVLHAAWKDKNPDLGRTFSWALTLIVAGFVFTFPLFFGLFAH
jgi:hypothetical protein